MKNITIAVCGGIAAYKSLDVMRQLYHDGYQVQPVLTRGALNFITELSAEVLCDNVAYSDEWKQRRGDGALAHMLHIQLARQTDLLVVVPATAHTIAKMAHGLADDLLTNLYLALDRNKTKVLIVPAMNPNMWSHPAVQHNIQTLKNLHQAEILLPASGEVACGDHGEGKLPTVAQIVDHIKNINLV